MEVARKNLEEIAQPLSAEDEDDRDRFDRGGGLTPTPAPSGLRGRVR